MSEPALYLASPIKRKRRTKADIDALCDAMLAILKADHPMTIRQMFYQMVSAGRINKTETEYDNVVVRLLVRMREDGRIPYDWIGDNTRWMRGPSTYDSVEDALDEMARLYRKDLWRDTEHRVEVWLEKDALAGVLLKATYPWHVPLMVTRGYSSLSFLYSSAMAIRAANKPTYIYYFGDYDPSGRDIAANTEKRLREYAPDSEIHFELVAVTEEQIRFWNLPTRPTKRTDARAKKWKGGSVEVDAIPSKHLITLAESRILSHLDMAQVEAIRTTERAERETLRELAGIWERDDDEEDTDES